MLTALATTITARERLIADWTSISIFRPAAERQRVGRAERGRVRERDVEVVEEERPPAGLDEHRLGLLGEEEVALGRGRGGAAERPAAVELPVPEPEQEHVHDPHVDGRPQQGRGVRLRAVHQQVDEQDDRGRVRGAHDRDRPEREAAAREAEDLGAPVEYTAEAPARADHAEREEDEKGERRHDPAHDPEGSPARPHDEARREVGVEPGGADDRGRGPER
jgi:hypothetical protein